MALYATMGQNTAQNHDFNYKLRVETKENNFTLDHFEILTNPDKVQYRWLKSESGGIPANTVICSEEFDQVYYCGRMQVFDKGLMPAKIADGVAYVHYFQVRSSTDFEYLVYA